MAFLGSIGKFIQNAIPNEVKSVVSNVIPNEIKPYIGTAINDYDKLVAQKQAEQAAAATVAPNGGAPQYDDTLLKAFNAQLAIEPKLLAANQLYQPQWLDLQKQIQATAAKNQMDLMGVLYPQSAQIESTYQNLLRRNQLQQLETTLPEYQRAFNALTPGYAGAIANMGALAQSATQRANVAPTLTNYEAQVAPIYGNAPSPFEGRMSLGIRPPGGVYPNGMAYETSESRSTELPPAAGARLQSPIPMGTPLPPGVQGPQAPSQEYLNAQIAARNQQLRAQQVSGDAQKIQALPRMTQEQAWGLQPAQAAINRYNQQQPNLNAYVGKLSNIMQQELNAGRELTREEQRLADQAARSAYAARGTALGPQAAAAEILNRADVADRRYQQRLATAQNAANQIQGIQQSAFQQALARGQAEQQRLQAANTIQAGQAQIGAGALGQLQQAQAPILQAYYQQPILQQTVGQAQTMGLANQQASGNTLFQPESSLAFQSAFLPYQGSIALQAAQLQANAAKSAGQTGLFGNLGGSAISAALPTIISSFCWVAREVYGTETGTWKVFRAWLLERAPEWLRNAYIKHGQSIAEFIKDKPVLKSVIRRWMDSKIESYLTA